MAKFEDHLFDDLMRDHGSALDTAQHPAEPSRRRGIGIGLAALGVAGAVLLTGVLLTGGSAAYAVTQDTNGTVTVSLSDLSGVTGANEELRRLGVRAVAVPIREGCADLDSLPINTTRPGSPTTVTIDSDDVGSGSMTFDAGSIPEDSTMLLAASSSPSGVALASVLIRGEAPECVSVPPPPAHRSPEATDGPGARQGGN